jgi:DNA-binding winged helix-turn-helix (wHTH) protein
MPARTLSSRSSIRFGPFELKPLTGELCKDGVRLKISGQPLEILLILIVRGGEVVARDEFRDSLWSSDTFVDFEHSLNTAIKRLRVALDDDVASPQYIETVPRRGYRFIGEIAEDKLGIESIAEHEPVDVASAPQTQDTPPATKSNTHLRLLIALGAILCFVGGFLFAKLLEIFVH